MKVRPAALIYRKGAILTMRYQIREEFFYVLPGGNPDPGESLKVALKRELAEELGVQVAVEDMILVGEVLHFNQKEDTLHCLFRVTIEKGEPCLDPAHTTAQSLEWLLWEQLSEVTLYPNFSEHLTESFFEAQEFSYTGPLKQPFKG